MVNIGSKIIGHKKIIGLMEHWVNDPGFAYLFYGPAHIGKSLMADYFVRLLAECSEDQDLHLHPDIILFEPEEGKKEITVKAVREFRARMYEKPQLAKFTVAFLPQMEQLNDEGFNTLLKVMEEPPTQTVFVAVAQDILNIPQTILSRIISVPMNIVAKHEIVAGLINRGLSKDDAENKALTARGRPGLVLGEMKGQDLFMKNAKAYAEGPTTGLRLAAVDRLTKVCESAEDTIGAWRDALRVCGDALREMHSSLGIITYILGQGVADAYACLNDSISPRMMLDAAAINAERGQLNLPLIYPKNFPLSLNI